MLVKGVSGLGKLINNQIVAALELPPDESTKESRITGFMFIGFYLSHEWYRDPYNLKALFERDPTILQLVEDTVTAGPPETWNWDNVKRYPAFKQSFSEKPFQNVGGANIFKDGDEDPAMTVFNAFEQYRMLANKSIERPIQSLEVFPPVLYATFTFVRHADFKSTSTSVGYYWDSKADEPTSQGQYQLEALPNKWKDVPIDTIYSSDKIRAYETAKAIASASEPPKEVHQRKRLTEKEHGPTVDRYKSTGNIEAAFHARTGLDYSDIRYLSSYTKQVRFHIPEGGESEYDAAHRGQAEIISLLLKHGVPLSDEDKGREWDNVPEDNSWGDFDTDHGLSSKVPHIMIVSHNLFLTELYESLSCWDSPDHDRTGTEYRNADWSRHILRLSWPWDKKNWAGYSNGAKWFGLNVEKKNVKVPQGGLRFDESIPNQRAPAYRQSRG